MDFAALGTEIETDPAALGYAPLVAAGADQGIADLLNRADRPGQQNVGLGVLWQAFDNLADAQGMPVWEAIEAHKADPDALGIACRAAIRLRDARADYPPVNVQSAVFQAQLALLVQGTVLTQTQADAITALGNATVSRAEQMGLGPVSHADVARALRG